MQNHAIKLIIFLVFVFSSLIACANNESATANYAKLVPTTATASTKNLKPHSLRYEKLGGAMNYKMMKVDINGAPGWLVEIDFNQGGDATPDQIWLDGTTLAFRKRVLTLKDYTIDVTMSEGLFSGRLTPSENSTYKPVVYNKSYAHDAFEPAIINYALAALPLDYLFKASIPVFDLNNGSTMQWSNIRVLGEETIKIDGVKFHCWKVESNGIRNKTIWIDKEKQIAVKMKTKGNPGSWKIIPSSLKFF